MMSDNFILLTWCLIWNVVVNVVDTKNKQTVNTLSKVQILPFIIPYFNLIKSTVSKYKIHTVKD